MKNSETQSLTRTRAQLSAELADLDQLFSALYNRCSREQLLWRPGAGSWCIAECIEHVARGISQYLAPMRQAILNAGVVTEEQNNFLRRLNTEIDAREELNSRLTERMVRP